ncbi:MAG TPA: winged helix-turn-helix domain-containing protein [Streptosporangiaceae bacterium]|nr:winged helix-turn-helix domain-containing protein [Streptosporangiaceae bacterium]
MARGPERPFELVAADLRRRIGAGEWKSGEALPTVAGLAEHYGVSRATVTRVLRMLADEGLVRVVPRWGTFRA